MFTLVAWLSVAVAAAVWATRHYEALSRFCTIYLRFRYPITTIDGRGTLPTLPFVWPNGQGNVEKYLHGRENSIKWGKEYGPLYRIWSGFHGEIVLTRPADIETVFRDSHAHLKANANDSGHYMYQLLGICLGLVSGSEWRLLRKATDATFTRTAAATYVQTVLDHAKQHITSLSETKPQKWNLQPYADLRVYPFLALADLLYGMLTPKLKTQLLEIIPNRDSVFAHMMMGGVTRYKWAKYLPLAPNREMSTFKKAWGKWNDGAHAEALTKKDESAPIVQMYAAVETGDVSREALLQTMDEMLFANLDVSIGALTWAFVFIAAHPTVQIRVLAEITTAYHDEHSRDSYLMSQSTYLHHILLEAGRLRPVAAFSVAQACPTQRQLGDYVLPAGSKFVVDAYALNVRDPVWGEDSTSFRPERWAHLGAKDIRYCYWRFGFGPRICLGKYVVDLMMKALIVEVVRGWEIKLEKEGDGEWQWEKEGVEDMWAVPGDMRIACVRRET